MNRAATGNGMRYFCRGVIIAKGAINRTAAEAETYL